MRLSLIDADSIVYIIAWHHKDLDVLDDSFVVQAVDSIVTEILARTNATHYFGTFSAAKNFRDEIYRAAKYKGQRGEKPEWVIKWAPTIVGRLREHWGFVTPTLSIEADDVLAGYKYAHTELDALGVEIIYCSPDKDLKQLPGTHFDYKHIDLPCVTVNEFDAAYNFYYQMLVGDTVDNIKGIPGCGEKKAKEALKDCTDKQQLKDVVHKRYLAHFGEYYGEIIYEETHNTLQLLTPSHYLWDVGFYEDGQITYFENLLKGYRPSPVPTIDLDLPEL